jgi:hypothetical protein
MEMLIPGLCGLVVIIGIVSIVMSRDNWSAPQMILVGLVLVASLVFFYFSARTFVLAKNWNDEIKNFNVAINEVEHGKNGIEQLTVDRDRAQHDIEVAMASRGRAWHEAGMVRANPDTGEITATVDDPAPHGIEPHTSLFVFEQSDKGKYLGEFMVTATKDGDKVIKMVPSLALSQGELNDISRSHGRLDLYETMPADSHTLFSQFDNRDEMLKNAFSGDVVPEYQRDFTPATEKDLQEHPDRVYRWVKFTQQWTSDLVPGEKGAAPAAPPAGAAAFAPAAPGAAPAANNATASSAYVFKPGDTALFDSKTAADLVETKKVAAYDADPGKGMVYVRPLRDYAMLFRESARQRTRLNVELADATSQHQRVEAARTGILADVAATQKERDGLKQDLAHFQTERDIVAKFLNSLDNRNEELRVQLSKTFRENIHMAAEIDQINRSLIEEQLRRAPPVQSEANLAQ